MQGKNNGHRIILSGKGQRRAFYPSARERRGQLLFRASDILFRQPVQGDRSRYARARCLAAWGCAVALSLSLVIAVIPALCGFSLVGSHMEFSWFRLIYNFLYFLLIIGPVEEFVFRVYLQDVFTGFFDKHKWIGVIISAFLFGLWHLINGNIIQVLFTFCIGLVFGFAKYRIKNCGYAGVAFAHGSYDFLNIIVRMFIVR